MKLFQSDLLSVTGFIFVICFTDSTKRTIHGDTVFSVRITCQKLGRQMFAYKMSNRRTEKTNKEAPWRSINPRGTHLIPVRKLPYPHQLHAHHGNSSGHLPPVGVTLQLLAWWCCISLEFFFFSLQRINVTNSPQMDTFEARHGLWTIVLEPESDGPHALLSNFSVTPLPSSLLLLCQWADGRLYFFTSHLEVTSLTGEVRRKRVIYISLVVSLMTDSFSSV